jgi:hypothetical protein
MLDIIKEILAENGKSQEKDEEKKLEEQIEELAEYKEQHPNKWGFIADQVVTAIRESYVPNQKDVVYQFTRMLAGKILKGKYNISSDLVKEGFAITLYKRLNDWIGKLSDE